MVQSTWRMFMPFILFFVLLFTGLSSAQTWQMPARQIYVDNSTFTNIDYSTNVPASLQTTLSYIDSNWVSSASFFQLDSEVDALNVDFTNLIQTLSTEITAVSNYVGVVSNNIVAYIDSRLEPSPIISTNVLLSDLTLSIISQDFRNAYSYLLGGTQQFYSGFTTSYVNKSQVINTITNNFVEAVYTLTPAGSFTNSSDGSANNAALVPKLQYNQDITKTNFIGVNQNTYFTTNLFSIVGSLFGLTNTTGVSEDFNNWVGSFVQMNTNYGNLPTNLTFNFPNLIQTLNTDIGAVSNFVKNLPNIGVATYLLNSIADPIDTVATNVFKDIPVFSTTTNELASNPAAPFNFGVWDSGANGFTFSKAGTYVANISVFSVYNSSSGANTNNNFTIYTRLKNSAGSSKFTLPLLNGYQAHPDGGYKGFLGDQAMLFDNTMLYTFDAAVDDDLVLVSSTILNYNPSDVRCSLEIPALLISIYSIDKNL